MYVLLPLLLFIATDLSAAQSVATEPHLREVGSSAIFLRSAFAHGYRHGYEDGYHVGNIDANMNRQPRAKASQLHGIASRYAPEFGSRKSFEAGFEEGLRAGYNDGFVGRNFRAIDNLRFIAMALDQKPAATDPTNLYFDQGVSTGYDRGLDRAQRDGAEGEQLDVRFIGCEQFHPNKQQDVAAQGSFCDGYHRGFVLGHADGIVFSPGLTALTARK